MQVLVTDSKNKGSNLSWTFHKPSQSTVINSAPLLNIGTKFTLYCSRESTKPLWGDMEIETCFQGRDIETLVLAFPLQMLFYDLIWGFLSEALLNRLLCRNGCCYAVDPGAQEGHHLSALVSAVLCHLGGH